MAMQIIITTGTQTNSEVLTAARCTETITQKLVRWKLLQIMLVSLSTSVVTSYDDQ